MKILPTLPMPAPGDRLSLIGNTGEGKSVVAACLLTGVHHGIIINSKSDPFFSKLTHGRGGTIKDDKKIFNVGEGLFNYEPSQEWIESDAMKNRFFAWALKAGNRVLYIDEWDDVCPNGIRYPIMVKKAIRQGRWRKLSIWGTAQEWAYVPRFCFSQSQYFVIFYVGNPDHRKLASRWVQTEIPWDLIPERSHRFLVKTPRGVFGPQPRMDISRLKERISA